MIVERSPTRTRSQLAALLDELERTNGRFFAGLHTRYPPFNAYIRTDLVIDGGDPVSCDAVVYEIPLPASHWYNWPSSGTRILSNACRWVDHFLYLKGLPEVEQSWANLNRDRTVVCSLVLRSGASPGVHIDRY